MDGAARTVGVVGAAGDPVVEAVRRLCAVAGTETVTAADRGAALALWRGVTAVAVASDAADWVTGLARRPAVAVVAEPASEAGAWRAAVAVGADAVFLAGPGDRDLLEWLALAVEPPAAAAAVGVTAGCGGAGASTFAAALALTAGGAERVTLLDADPDGGGLDVLVGAERLPGRRWPDLLASRGVVAAGALADALPRVEGVAVLSWTAGRSEPAAPEAMEALLAAALRGSDLVVVDLPRRADPAAHVVVPRLSRVLVVVPASVRAVAASAGALAHWRGVGADVALAVRHPGPADLTPQLVAQALGEPLACVVPHDDRLAEAADRGAFARALRRSRVATVALRARRDLVS